MQYKVPAYAFRGRARQAMKAMMSVLIVVALIAALPSLIGQTICLVTGATTDTLMETFANRMMQVTEKYGLDSEAVETLVLDEAALLEDTLSVYEQFMQDLETFVKEKGPIIAVTALVERIITPVLSLGLINALLHALRKQEFTASIVMSRIQYFFKAVGLWLLTSLKVLLWMLPGLAVYILSVFLPVEGMALCMLLGLVLMLVPGIMAAYRYALAEFVLADAPQTRVTACIRRSCEVMRRRKGELFCLELSFTGWYLLLTYGRALLTGMLGSVLGMTLGMFISLFLTVYMNMARAAFYQEYAVGPLPQQTAAAPQESKMTD